MTTHPTPAAATGPPLDPLDGRDIVDQVVHHLTIYDWSYTRDPSLRHLGPMADAMYEKFGIGNGHQLATVDVLGLVLLCIKVIGADQRTDHNHIITLQQQLADAVSRIDELERAIPP